MQIAIIPYQNSIYYFNFLYPFYGIFWERLLPVISWLTIDYRQEDKRCIILSEFWNSFVCLAEPVEVCVNHPSAICRQAGLWLTVALKQIK